MTPTVFTGREEKPDDPASGARKEESTAPQVSLASRPQWTARDFAVAMSLCQEYDSEDSGEEEYEEETKVKKTKRERKN